MYVYSALLYFNEYAEYVLDLGPWRVDLRAAARL